MKARRLTGLIAAVFVVSVSSAGWGITYSTHYDCTPGRTTALVITNASDYTLEEGYVLRLYGPDGRLLQEVSGGLTEYESTVLLLNEIVEPADATCWGLAQVESSLLLVLGTWIGEADHWVAVINTGTSLLQSGASGAMVYWYSLNFANTENRRTGIELLNPHTEAVAGAVDLYDALGKHLASEEFELEPHQADYFSPEATFPIADTMWGIVDLRAAKPLLMVGEYFDADGALFDVDIADAPYYLQFPPEE